MSEVHGNGLEGAAVLIMQAADGMGVRRAAGAHDVFEILGDGGQGIETDLRAR